MPPFGRGAARCWSTAAPGRGNALDSSWQVVISPSFFETVGAPVLRGRVFDARDGGKGAEVAIVNQRFAARHFPGEDPIGRRIRFHEEPATTPLWMTIVGISPTSGTATRATATSRTSPTCR